MWPHRVERVSEEKELLECGGQSKHQGKSDARNTCSVWEISQAGGDSGLCSGGMQAWAVNPGNTDKGPRALIAFLL